ncbi:MAG: C4-dicarboxylate ABC transporter permease [Lachnospiraceae bacterium]|nr:C4-dicarboxylate ABC transporter permease [Lachnospiraceae bacterium]
MFAEVISGIFSLNSLLMMNIGMAVGIIIGALPGLNVIFAITVLMPLTFDLPSISGVFLLLGAYCGAMYGGSITAVLLNTPGTPASVTTSFDGYPMAQKGRAGDALKLALLGSTFGGLFSALVLLILAPTIARLILNVGSPEYFSLCVFGLFAAVGIAGEGNAVKGIIMALLGLFLSTVGMDTFQGTARYMFGETRLLAGLKAAVIMLGTYALSEILVKSREIYVGMYQEEVPRVTFQKATVKVREFFRHWKILIKSSVMGCVIGAVPGTGGAIAAMFAYTDARRSSKTPEKFGSGSDEGIVASETANNAVTGATLIPLFTFGIPGDAPMAVLLSALTMQGITVGTQLFTGGNPWIYIIMGGLILVNLFMLVQGSLFIRAFANVTRVPLTVILPVIMVLCMIGTFAISNSMFDIRIMLAFGLLGFLMKRFRFPIPPLTIGLVLGNLMESNLRRSLLLSGGSYGVFVTRPFSLVILLIAFGSLFYPAIRRALKKNKTEKAG